MYIGNEIQSFGDAVEYAERLYREAYSEMQARFNEMQEAVFAFADSRDTADAKTLARLKRVARNASRHYVTAFKAMEYRRAYLQGIRDMTDTLS